MEIDVEKEALKLENYLAKEAENYKVDTKIKNIISENIEINISVDESKEMAFVVKNDDLYDYFAMIEHTIRTLRATSS